MIHKPLHLSRLSAPFREIRVKTAWTRNNCTEFADRHGDGVTGEMLDNRKGDASGIPLCISVHRRLDYGVFTSIPAALSDLRRSGNVVAETFFTRSPCF